MLAFVIAAALLTMSPGPDTLLVLRNTLRGGRAEGLRTTLGITFGLVVHATLSALGLSLILVQSATAFELVKLAGAGYLIWLGAQSLLRRHTRVTTVAPTGPTRPFREGFLTNVLNPKVAVFYLAFLPQFHAPPFLLAAIHMVMGLVWLSIVSAAVIVTSPVVERWMDRVCGVVLVGLGVQMVREAA